MVVEQIRNVLAEIQIGDKRKPGSLMHLACLIGAKEYKEINDITKEQIISIKEQILALLCAYYSTPGRFEELWDSLSDAERKIISLHIWSNGHDPAAYADDVAVEFGIARNHEVSYYAYGSDGLTCFMEKYAGAKSNIWLLLPGTGYNRYSARRLFQSELCNAAGEMKREYTQVQSDLAFASRECRSNDYANIVRFCNANRLILTKSGIPGKPSALKLMNFCGYEEYTAEIRSKPEDIKAADGLLVTYPLMVLCTVGGLLVASEGECIPGVKSGSLITLPHEQLVQKLFNAYISSKSFDEISMLKGLKSKRGHHPFEARQGIAGELKHCPVGKPLYTKEFEKYLHISNDTFARKESNRVVYSGSGKYDYSIGWESYEHVLINIILSFFGALGIIDIAWGDEKSASNFSTGKRAPVAFKINPLGAYVLGLSDSYTVPVTSEVKVKGGFTVLPDYSIIIADSAKRVRHELFFERVFTKVSSTNEASIYKLDFETIVRAIDNGTSIAALQKYLSGSDKPVPENVTRALADWKKQAGRIRVRQVTILECDNAALLEEVIHYKGMGEFVKGKVGAAVVVDGSETGKIKKLIEKNKRFCDNAI